MQRTSLRAARKLFSPQEGSFSWSGNTVTFTPLEKAAPMSLLVGKQASGRP